MALTTKRIGIDVAAAMADKTSGGQPVGRSVEAADLAALPRRGVSVRWWLGALTLGAVASAALASPNSLWAPVLTELAVAAQIVAMVATVFGRGETRTFFGGYAIGSGLILLVEFIPAIGRPLIHRMLPWSLWSPQSPLLVGTPVEDRAYVGIIISAMVYGYLGGVVARRAFRAASRPAT